MLKIKDNVDLKELEKFGFRKHKKDDEITIISKWAREYIDEDSLDGIARGSYDFYPIIRITLDRTILLPTYNSLIYQTIDTLYDLIQAGLVEKEGE